MADSNNVVIKINYTESSKSPYKRSEPETVTEWHYKRIVIALILLVAFIIFPFYYFSNNSVEQQTEKLTSVIETKPIANNIPRVVDKQPVKINRVKEIEIKTIINNPVKAIKKEQLVIDIKPVEKIKAEEKSKPEINPSQDLVDKKIVRALLTTGLNNKEPLDVIVPPVIVNKNKVTGVFYFTEIVDMEGRGLYHHWLWNDRVIYNRKINILGDRWRASTSKLIPYSKAGNWTVRLVNNEGIVLNEIKFKVIQQ